MSYLRKTFNSTDSDFRVVTESIIEQRRVMKWLTNYSIPLEVEVGFGASKTLLQLAESNPSCCYVGVETNWTWCVAQVVRQRNWGLRNVCFVNLDGHKFLETYVPSGRLSCVHLYFPTPFPAARRLFTRDFAREVYRVLDCGGCVRMITDIEDYYHAICGLLDEFGWAYIDWTRLPLPIPSRQFVGTPCEVAYGSRWVLQVRKP